ncbi:MAG: hypothetical protein NT029_15165 [Armatimonadetes bacterium]|nr:hypothetical protein [Armatimonadota bacterium]
MFLRKTNQDNGYACYRAIPFGSFAPALTVEKGANQSVRLVWTALPGAAQYRVERLGSDTWHSIGLVEAGLQSFTDAVPGAPVDGKFAYRVRVLDAAGDRICSNIASLYAGLTVTLSTPTVLRPDRQYTAALTVVNNTRVAQPLPLYVARNSGGSPMRLSNRAPWRTGPLQLQFVGSGTDKSVIQPGEMIRVPYYFNSPNLGGDGSLHHFLACLVQVSVQGGHPLDMAAVEAALKPEGVDQGAWNVVWPNLQARFGTTWESYQARLSAVSSYLAANGNPSIDVRRQLALDMTAAFGGMSPTKYLVSAVDAAAPAPALAPVFSRSARSTIDQRFRLGPLGRGWSHNYEYLLRRPEAARVVIAGPGGSSRTFLNATGAGWQGQAGDTGRLTEPGDATYRLREKTGLVWIFGLDGLLQSLEDPNGNKLTMNYSGTTWTGATHSNGEGIAVDYAAGGRISKVTDSRGRATSYEYDASGEHLLRAIGFDGRTTTYTYWPADAGASAHALASITYPDGRHQYYEYDAQGRVSAQGRDGGSERTVFLYDNFGSVQAIDGTGRMTLLTLGAFGEPMAVTNPGGETTRFTYDDDMNVIGLVDAANGTGKMGYDDRDNPTSGIDAAGNSIAAGYTADFGGLSWMRDARGILTKFGSDANGNLTGIEHTDGSLLAFKRDAAGNVTEARNRRGETLRFTYNAAGQMTGKLLPNGRQYAYDYDGRGNLKTASDSVTGNILMEYDAHDWLAKITYPSGAWFSFEYDSGGRRTRRVGHDGYTLEYEYDAAGRLRVVRDGTGPMATYQYDPAGRLSREEKGNGTATLYDYNAAGRVSLVQNLAPNGTVQSSFAYSYDANGNPTKMDTQTGSWQYGYDKVGQLTGTTYPDGHAVAVQYDVAGNRMTVNDAGAVTAYTTDALNQYARVGDTVVQYDADGNMTSRTDGTGATTYTWDSENRLTSVTSPAGEWTYQHDALGNRTAVVRNGATTRYLLDPAGLGDVAAETTGSGTLVARYVHGLGLLARTDGGGSAYYAFDATGSTRQITDAAGAVVNQYDYHPFGGRLAATEGVPNPFGFVGRYGVMEEGNGLQFMRARYYDARAGRFVSADPLHFGGGDANLYRYVLNSPIMCIDASGMWLWVVTDVLWPTAVEVADRAWRSFIWGKVRDAVWKSDPVQIWWGGKKRDLRDYSDRWAEQHGFWNTDNWVDRAFDPPPYPHRCVLEPPNPPTDPAAEAHGHIITPGDPNEKVGAAGAGPNHAITGGDTIPYTVYFENKSTATAPAQEVFVTDALDANLDLGTFELDEIVFGKQTVSALSGAKAGTYRVPLAGTSLVVDIAAGLDASTGKVTWSLRTIDPETNLLPEDPFAGLLPPNDATGRGEGHLTFRIRPRDGLANGTAISNMATIVFDTEKPISTNTWSNRIDRQAPTTLVAALPAQMTGATFPVSWSGQDDDGGAGLASFDVYVSDNGGQFALWKSETTGTTAEYTGLPGHTYGFYSVGRDALGNLEQKSAADATTTVASGASKLYVVDRTWVGATAVPLKAYLYRKSDSFPLVGMDVTLSVAGTAVGTAKTKAGGEAMVSWVIDAGPATRQIRADFAGDGAYGPCTGTGQLTVLTYKTTMSAPDRSGQVLESITMKGYLYRTPGSAPVVGKAVTFSVDSTIIGSATTNSSGRALITWTVPESLSPGAHGCTVAWAGDAGYNASSAAPTLRVSKGVSYLWLAKGPVKKGAATYIRAYLRRLPDYVWMSGRTVTFALDGTALGQGTTDAAGMAAYLYNCPASAVTGDHQTAAEFPGDDRYLASGSEATLTVTP